MKLWIELTLLVSTFVASTLSSRVVASTPFSSRVSRRARSQSDQRSQRSSTGTCASDWRFVLELLGLLGLEPCDSVSGFSFEDQGACGVALSGRMVGGR